MLGVVNLMLMRAKIFLFLVVTSAIPSLCMSSNSLTRPPASDILESIEESLCALSIESLVSPASFHGALAHLRNVKRQIVSIHNKYAAQPDIISAIEILLALKGQQIRQSRKSLVSLTSHLQQLKEGLSYALRTDYNSVKAHGQEVTISYNHTLAIDILTNSPWRSADSISISNSGNMHPALVRTLKTGAFIMVMLSTAADVCVVAGPVVCFALYIAGSGAVVIWLAQIYRAMFGIN